MIYQATYDPERPQQSPEHTASVRHSIMSAAVRNLYDQIPAEVEPIERSPKAAAAVVSMVDRPQIDTVPAIDFAPVVPQSPLSVDEAKKNALAAINQNQIEQFARQPELV
jgi:hypothetical protein